MPDMDTATLISDYAIPWGIKIGLALVIFIIGRMLVSLVVSGVTKVLNARGMDEILVSFLTSILRWVLLLFVVVAALSQLAGKLNPKLQPPVMCGGAQFLDML